MPEDEVVEQAATEDSPDAVAGETTEEKTEEAAGTDENA